MKKGIIIVAMLLISFNIYAENISNHFNHFKNKNVEVLHSIGGGRSIEKGLLIEILDNGIIMKSKDEMVFINFDFVIKITTKKS